MLKKRLIFGTVAAAAVMFVFEWLYHGIYMMPTYQATASLWRTQEEMQQFSPVWCIGMKLALGFAFAWLFSRHYEGRGPMEGLRFGAYVGALLGILQIYPYFYMPVPLGIPLSWAAGWLLESVLVGLALAYAFGFAARKTA